MCFNGGFTFLHSKEHLSRVLGKWAFANFQGNILLKHFWERLVLSSVPGTGFLNIFGEWLALSNLPPPWFLLPFRGNDFLNIFGMAWVYKHSLGKLLSTVFSRTSCRFSRIFCKDFPMVFGKWTYNIYTKTWIHQHYVFRVRKPATWSCMHIRITRLGRV